MRPEVCAGGGWVLQNPSEPSRLTLPQTHLEGENSCGAARVLGHIPVQLCFSPMLSGQGALRDPRVGSVPGGPCPLGNHVLGLGPLREARGEARGSSHPPGMVWPGFSSGSGPQSSCPGSAGCRGGRGAAVAPRADGPSASELPLPHRLPGPAV